jgi:hypothetical protein
MSDNSIGEIKLSAKQIIDGGGLRFDAGKLPIHLIPASTLIALGSVMRMGALKYGDRNWERGMAWSKVLGPLKRHLTYWELGEKKDKESRLSHLYHVIWNVMALIEYELTCPELNDLPPPNPRLIEELENIEKAFQEYKKEHESKKDV